jgi:hypothetical protein
MTQSQVDKRFMKSIHFITLWSLLMFITAMKVNGQFSITKVTDLNFGTFYCVSGTCTVTISPDGSRSKTGNLVFLGQSSVYSRAEFTVSDVIDPNHIYSINALPASISLTGPGTSMSADSFLSNPTVATGGTVSGGTQTLYVGATLNLTGPQLAGIYTSSFSVTVVKP